MPQKNEEAQYVRRLGRKTPQTYELYREFVETRPPEGRPARAHDPRTPRLPEQGPSVASIP